MLANIASGFLVIACAGFATFQIAILFGAPLAQYSDGGKSSGKLSPMIRLISALRALFYLATSGHYLAQLGVFAPLLDDSGNAIVNWVFTLPLAIAAIFYNLTDSDKERRLFGATSITMVIASLLVALQR